MFAVLRSWRLQNMAENMGASTSVGVVEEAKGSVNLVRVVSACFDLANQAGEVVRTVMKSGDLKTVEKDEHAASSGVAVDSKTVVDPQTIADIKAQKLIVGSLKRLWPSLHIIGEEGALEILESDTILPRVDQLDQILSSSTIPPALLSVPLSDLTVFVDPLDGTKEFVKGETHAVTVLIGIALNGKAVAGVIHQPFAETPRTVWGIVGVGAFGHNPAPPAPANRRLVVTTSSHISDALKAIIQTVNPTEMIQAGGAGNKGLYVLEGKADAYMYPSKGTKKWDTCALEAVIRAAGGMLTDGLGQEIPYFRDSPASNHQGVLVTLSNHQSYVVDTIVAKM